MNKMPNSLYILIILSGVILTSCSVLPERQESDEPEILTIYPDGSMTLMGRPIPPEDVIIYPDGYGGEKAAIKSGLEPLHPPFYRDTIIVDRVDEEKNADNRDLFYQASRGLI